ncbi:HAD family hydrolase [Rhodococcus sp. SBT000017]|uniref:HAD family hydrolase n=1 Tax=Rhodococcus sp. SBT000017 TaxID=1803385 RepID=UPI000EF88496|nr:HAD family hydrolase [Rhodococcus sp. SBT000017]RMB78048.1 HAD family hydrolase [Rhodococcus sp. SBT000017]
MLDQHERVTERTRRAVSAVVADGVPFVLSTGRPPRWIHPVVDQLGYAPMSVCANGAVIYDAANDRVLSAETLSVETLQWLADLAYRALPGCGLAAERVGRTAHDSATPQFVSSPGYEHAWLNPDNVEMTEDDVVDVPAVKLLIRLSGSTSGHMADILSPLISGRADLTFSTDNGLIELSAPGITKASGLAKVAETLSVDVKDIVAFGDMPNDVPMLSMVGLGVAMGNAHPAAVAAANEQTVTNAEDGVAHVLERWW